MANRVYNKEDLIWEAVRRNEEYKQFYSDALESGKIDLDDKWFFGHNGLRWKLFEECVLDPEIDIDTIREQIRNGADPDNVHPYHWLFHVGLPKKAFAEIDIPELKIIRKKEMENGKATIMINNSIRVFLNKIARLKEKRVLLAFDPQRPREEIVESILNIKSNFIYHNKDENQIDTRSIDDCIRYLRRYDELLTSLIEEEGKENVIFSDGVFQKPEKFNFTDLIPISAFERKKKEMERDSVNDVYDTVLKTYKKAYDNAKTLISAAPRIKFKVRKEPYRVKK